MTTTIVCGEQGSGKTTYAHRELRLRHENTIFISPHLRPSEGRGYNTSITVRISSRTARATYEVRGEPLPGLPSSGQFLDLLDYIIDGIERDLERMIDEDLPPEAFPEQAFIFDECLTLFNSIPKDKLPNVQSFFECILTEPRKVNKFFYFLLHTTTVSSIGIRGLSDLWKSTDWVFLGGMAINEMRSFDKDGYTKDRLLQERKGILRTGGSCTEVISLYPLYDESVRQFQEQVELFTVRAEVAERKLDKCIAECNRILVDAKEQREWEAGREQREVQRFKQQTDELKAERLRQSAKYNLESIDTLEGLLDLNIGTGHIVFLSVVERAIELGYTPKQLTLARIERKEAEEKAYWQKEIDKLNLESINTLEGLAELNIDIGHTLFPHIVERANALGYTEEDVDYAVVKYECQQASKRRKENNQWITQDSTGLHGQQTHTVMSRMGIGRMKSWISNITLSTLQTIS